MVSLNIISSVMIKFLILHFHHSPNWHGLEERLYHLHWFIDSQIEKRVRSLFIVIRAESFLFQIDSLLLQFALKFLSWSIKLLQSLFDGKYIFFATCSFKLIVRRLHLSKIIRYQIDVHLVVFPDKFHWTCGSFSCSLDVNHTPHTTNHTMIIR